MRTIIYKLSVFLFSIAIFTSCKTHSHSFRKVDINNENLQTENVVVNVKPNFTKKVSGVSTKKHDTEKAAKEEAYFNAIIENNIDVLVNPIYSVSSTRKILFLFGGKSQAQVQGYAGYYENPRPESEYERQQLDEKIEHLEEFAKIADVQEVVSEKTYTVNSTCGDCKGNDALTLVSVLDNKESMIDAYVKFENITNNRDINSNNNKKSLFFNKSDKNSVSKKKSFRDKVYNFLKNLSN